MKQSEMAKLMTEHWLSLWSNEYNGDNRPIQEKVHERMFNILDILTYHGMLPPEVNWNEGNGAGIPSYCTNEWEPE